MHWKDSCYLWGVGFGSKSQVARPFLHGLNAEADVRIEIDAQFRGALDHILPVHALGEGLILHLPAHARDLDLGDGLAGFHQCARRQKAGQLIAGKQHLVQMGHARHAGIFRMAQDGDAQLLGPALPLQFADAYKRVLLAGGMALVVEVVQQGSGGVELQETRALLARHGQPVRLLLAVRGDACFHRKCVFPQAFAGGPLGQELPSLFSPVPAIRVRAGRHNKKISMLQHLVRVSSGFSGYYGCDLGLTLSLYLTIMVHPPQISTYTGAEKRRGRPALATREQPMATALVSVETREVVRCEYCALVQYRTSNSLCRKCHRPLDIEEPYALGPQPVPSPLPF